mmetsp:Transcript_17075/g.36053  ORF Transcript_17075/g.36053 Transcript_17075/m.36053 type:complete len:391 (+) Transcript_17075:1134-2306(+)
MHEDAVGEEDEPVVLQLRAAARGARLLLEEPAVRHVGHLLLQHDHLLQPQVPLRQLHPRVRLDLEGLVPRLDLKHLVLVVGGQLEGVSKPRVDLAGEEGRGELLVLNVTIGEKPEGEGLPFAGGHLHEQLGLEDSRHRAAADGESERLLPLDHHLRHLLDGAADDALHRANDVALDERALAVGRPVGRDGAHRHLAVPQVDGDAQRASRQVAHDRHVEELLLQHLAGGGFGRGGGAQLIVRRVIPSGRRRVERHLRRLPSTGGLRLLAHSGHRQPRLVLFPRLVARLRLVVGALHVDLQLAALALGRLLDHLLRLPHRLVHLARHARLRLRLRVLHGLRHRRRLLLLLRLLLGRACLRHLLLLLLPQLLLRLLLRPADRLFLRTLRSLRL